MAGGILRALYSGTRGLDLGPTKLRLDERFRGAQLAEDMRRALAGEKIQESELALRQSALAQQKESDQQRMAMEQALQTQRIQAQQQEGAAQRAFQGQEGGLDRAAREKVLQLQQAFGAGEAENERAFQMAQREADRKQSAEQFGARMAAEKDRFDKQFALETDAAKRQEMYQNRNYALQERMFNLQQQEFEERKAGRPNPETQAKMEQLQLELAALKVAAEKAGLARMPQENEAARAGIDATKARTEYQKTETEALKEALAGKKAGPAGMPGAVKQTTSELKPSEQEDAVRWSRLIDDKKANDVQKMGAKALEKLNAVAGAKDKDAKRRAADLRELVELAKTWESKDMPRDWTRVFLPFGIGLASGAEQLFGNNKGKLPAGVFGDIGDPSEYGKGSYDRMIALMAKYGLN